MPRSAYDLDRERASVSLRALVALAIACAATGAVIVFVQNIGVWLIP
jgi:hypothetical protein